MYPDCLNIPVFVGVLLLSLVTYLAANYCSSLRHEKFPLSPVNRFHQFTSTVAVLVLLRYLSFP